LRNKKLFLGLFAVAAAGVGFFVVPSAAAPSNADCLMCHGQEDSGPLFVDEKKFAASIHGRNLCVSCHKDALEIPHPDKLAPVSCSNCHRLENKIYLNSDHGRALRGGRPEAATCKDCHGHSHTLLNSRNPASPVNRANIVNTCGQCHADTKRMSRFRLSEKDPLESYNETVHGKAFAEGRTNAAVCSDCHGTHDLHGASNPLSRVFRANIPNTCQSCHQNVALTYNESVHGQAAKAGLKESPVCTDCHGEHTILSPTDPGSSTFTGAITKTCSTCHTSLKLAAKVGLPVDRMETYKDSYHGLAGDRGNLRVANCASCHGFHDVLPSSDPRSSINRANLANTCGKCHTGAGERLSTGYVHGVPTDKHWTLVFVKKFYLLLIPLTLGLMLLHNFFDWLRKAWSGDPARHGHEANEIRLTRNERVQHFVLMGTFSLLAYTGFAARFSAQPWVQYVAPFSEEMRRSIHLWSALVFSVLSVYHLAYMGFSTRGRKLLRAFWPRWDDVKVFTGRQLYNLGLKKNPPQSTSFFNYAEKIEYWAMVWGSVIMAVTGCLQVFNNTALKYLPLWMMDLAMQIHFYEAVLALLAILIWHIYGVMLDPDVYPLNWAWLTGRVKPNHTKKPPDKKS
jgi:cytochrome b subunit of formate dehydrogenase